MRSDSLYPSLLVSFIVHTCFFAVIILIMTFSRTYVMPTTYVVSLVEGPSKGGSRVESPKAVEQPAPEPRKSEKVPDTKLSKQPLEKELVTDRIAALKAKRKVERLAALKRSLDVSRKTAAIPAAAAGSGGGSTEYEALVISRIHDHFTVPERIDKDLLAIINIRIARNGVITLEGFEQKSGNSIFDRAAIRAVTDASPLPPPPREMDFAIRFRP